MPSLLLTDDDFRALAQVSPDLAALLPLLGRDLRHSAANAERDESLLNQEVDNGSPGA